MQTFLPYPDFAASAAVLDDVRLGKQRVETLQILRALVFPSYRGWKNHPATRMWRGFTPALVSYGVAVCAEWTRRGRADAVAASLLEFTAGAVAPPPRLRAEGRLPLWFGNLDLHRSHRSSLVRKAPSHYRRYFPQVPDDLPYTWPDPVFDRWPLDPADPGLPELARAVVEAGGPVLWLGDAGEQDDPPPAPADLQPAVVTRPAGRLSVSIARPPTAADLASRRREAVEPLDVAFHATSALSVPSVRHRIRQHPPELLVLDGVADGARVTARVRRLAPQLSPARVLTTG